MKPLHTIVLLLSMLLAFGCWSYPKDVTLDATQLQDQGTPDSAGTDSAVLPDLTADGSPTPDNRVAKDEQSGYHPAGYSSPSQHGIDFNLQKDNCAQCHGEQLDGGAVGKSCDICHPKDWRTTCTFCHGGTNNETGAPPKGILGTDDPADFAFPAHGSHVTDGDHPAYSCATCHVVPEAALTDGHILDETPGKAEVAFFEGLNTEGAYNAATVSCSTSYCHGNGQGANGSVQITDGPLSCASCHAGPDSPGTLLGQMSGEHKEHIDEGISCHECHGDVLSGPGSFANASLHVNGEVNVKMPEGIEYSGGGCTGICHGENHKDEGW